MAAASSADQKKKFSRHVDRHSRDGSSGMSASTKRHFDHVKRKMFAFVDRQHRIEADGMHLTPSLPFQAHPPPPPPPIFADQKKASKPPSHHRTPAPSRQHLHASAPPHKQLPHLALATPHVARRGGQFGSNIDGRLSPNVARF